MKIIVYSLTAVLLAGLGIGWQLPVAKPPQHIDSVEAVPVVYVDTSKLLALHPAWRVLQNMEENCGQVAAPASSRYRQVGPFTNADDASYGASHAAADVSRSELDARAAESAVYALHDYERRLRASTRSRMMSMRSAMMAGAEASMVSEWQSAQSFADRTMKAVDERYASDRLNFRLQTLALTAAVGCAGVDRSDVELRLHRAESQLSELERDCDCEKQSIAAVADGKMEAMREAAAAAIDEKLEARRRQEEDRIDAAIVEARDEILGELEAFESSPSASRGVGSSELASTRGSRSSSTGAGGIAAVEIDARGAREDLSIAASRLREQIISDVERMVNEIAAQKGLRITHDPDEAESDSTSVFHEILSSRGWNESGPVLSAVVGS